MSGGFQSGFNLQSYLADMRRESAENHKALASKVDETLEIVNNHETRLVVVENLRTTLKWLAVTIIGALITLGVSLIRGTH